MAKKLVKLECVSNNTNKNGVHVMFAAKLETVKGEKPGEPDQFSARTVLQYQSTDPELIDFLRAFSPGKLYTVTIE